MSLLTVVFLALSPKSHLKVINLKSQVSSSKSFKSILGDTQDMIHPGAKFPTLCEPLTRQVVNFQNTLVEKHRIDIHTPKGRNWKE